ncbi:MAG: hypothetical protein M3Y77_00570 [Actinomycetota bacterium]|nr:hypothetical protein [Actinomycetota bacterium]MDQ2844864.1 hypothetical protein [Actinomycetota bacterium]
MTLFLILFLITLAIAGLAGRGTDSRDPRYSLCGREGDSPSTSPFTRR